MALGTNPISGSRSGSPMPIATAFTGGSESSFPAIRTQPLQTQTDDLRASAAEPTAPVRDPLLADDAKNAKKAKLVASGNKPGCFKAIADCFKNCFAKLAAFFARLFASKEDKKVLTDYNAFVVKEKETLVTSKAGDKVKSAREFLAVARTVPAEGKIGAELVKKLEGLSYVKGNQDAFGGNASEHDVRESVKTMSEAANKEVNMDAHKEVTFFFTYLGRNLEMTPRQRVVLFKQLIGTEQVFVKEQFGLSCENDLNKDRKGFVAFLKTAHEDQMVEMLDKLEEVVAEPLRKPAKA